jgi:tellurite resistance protein
VSDISPNGARRIYRILCNLAASDGSIDPTEREVMESVREFFDLTQEECEALEAEGASGKGLRLGKNEAEREYLMGCMIDVAAADGVLAPQERRRVHKFGKAVGLDRDELERRLIARFATTPASRRATSERPEIEALFPGYREEQRLEHEAFELYELSSNTDTREYGSDRETTAKKSYLLVGPATGWVLFNARRTYLASDRFDKESIDVSCELHSGESVPLAQSFDYEKYNHAQDYDRRSSLDPLLGPMKGWGFANLRETDLAGLVTWLTTLP